MPILIIPRDAPNPGALLEATMLWPDNPERRERFLWAIHASTVRGSIIDYGKKHDHIRISTADLAEISRTLTGAPLLSEVIREAQRDRFRGEVAGTMLLELLARKHNGSRNIRLGSVKDLSIKTLNGFEAFKLTLWDINNEIWPRYRTVSHLWAAKASIEMTAEGRRPYLLDDFLKIAEHFRVDGENLSVRILIV
jgi:hypothetical protein